MRCSQSLLPFTLTLAAGFCLAAIVFIAPDFAAADEKSGSTTCTCPDASGRDVRPKFADLHKPLDERDEIAALLSVQIALSQTEDGNKFVWRRNNGRLSGIVNPTSSFRNAAGSVCRHFVVMLTTGMRTKTAEGVACRLTDGRWQLEG